MVVLKVVKSGQVYCKQGCMVTVQAFLMGLLPGSLVDWPPAIEIAQEAGRREKGFDGTG